MTKPLRTVASFSDELNEAKAALSAVGYPLGVNPFPTDYYRERAAARRRVAQVYRAALLESGPLDDVTRSALTEAVVDLQQLAVEDVIEADRIDAERARSSAVTG